MRPPTPRPILIPRPHHSHQTTDDDESLSYSFTPPFPSPFLPTSSPLASPPRPPPFPTSVSPSAHHPSQTKRRLSSSSPLIGSFTSSLLALRLPGPLSTHDLPSFSARIRIPSSPPETLLLPFSASFCSLSSPYVGAISLPAPIPLPQKGSVQIVLLNPEAQPLRAFVVPYDARTLKPGERVHIRQMCYAPTPSSPSAAADSKGPLRYAVQLYLSCHPVSPPPQHAPLPFEMDADEPLSPPATPKMHHRRRSSTLSHHPHAKKQVLLHQSIRVVFPWRTADDDSPLRIETEVESSARAHGQGMAMAKKARRRSGMGEELLAGRLLHEGRDEHDGSPPLQRSELEMPFEMSTTPPSEPVERRARTGLGIGISPLHSHARSVRAATPMPVQRRADGQEWADEAVIR